MSIKKPSSDELKKRSYIEKYIPFVGEALKNLLNLNKSEEEVIEKAKALASTEDVILITGSIFVVGEARARLLSRKDKYVSV